MTEPDEPEIEFVEDEYSWAATPEERRRTFIVECCYSPEIDIHVQLAAFALLEPYLKDGTVPPKDDKPTKPRNIRMVT
jgi:hypothetical protein